MNKKTKRKEIKRQNKVNKSNYTINKNQFGENLGIKDYKYSEI
jgi:hypothetical protein